MKRELKDFASCIDYKRIDRDRKAHPDEKGTESYTTSAHPHPRSRPIAKPIPMKRELKVAKSVRLTPLMVIIAKPIPMKRELKVHAVTAQGEQHLAQSQSPSR